jgi:hypothetical protein
MRHTIQRRIQLKMSSKKTKTKGLHQSSKTIEVSIEFSWTQLISRCLAKAQAQ